MDLTASHACLAPRIAKEAKMPFGRAKDFFQILVCSERFAARRKLVEHWRGHADFALDASRLAAAWAFNWLDFRPNESIGLHRLFWAGSVPETFCFRFPQKFFCRCQNRLLWTVQLERASARSHRITSEISNNQENL